MIIPKSGFIISILFVSILTAGSIESLAQGEWYEIPNSKMRDVCPGLGDNWGYYCSSDINAWSGGAFDTKRDRLIIWGGGHADSPDNSVYVFDLNTQKWQRIWGPSSDFGGDPKSCLYPDGNPRSMHTYNYLQYLPSIDKFCSFGGAGCYPDGNAGTNKAFSFDFETKTWGTLTSVPVETGINAISGYDPVTDRAFLHCVSNGARLGIFDPVKNTWTSGPVNPWGGLYPSGTADVDVANRKLVLIGNDVKAWDVDNPAAEPKTIQTTGETGGLGPYNGVAYHPVSKKIFVWKGGKTVYTLDIAARFWEKYTGTGDDPGSRAQNGTFGRFRYSPAQDVFVVVNSVDANVFIYKPHAGNTAIHPSLSVSRSVSVKIWPNPVRTAATVSIVPVNGTVSIYDSQGRCMARLQSSSLWDVRAVPVGVYIARGYANGMEIRKAVYVIH